MDIDIEPTDLEGVLLVRPEAFEDERGVFYESWSRRMFADHGLHVDFVQDNHSRSRRGVLRGLHYQDSSAPQVRLVRCTVGTVFDVVVDLRVGSPTFAHWFGVELRADDRTQLLIGPEFAHGFLALSDVAEVQYKCSRPHAPSAERSVSWADRTLAISWPVRDPILSARDSAAPPLDAYLGDPCFIWAPPKVSRIG